MSKVLAFGMIDFYRARLIDAPTFRALAYLLAALVIISGVVTVVELVADRKSSSFAVQTRAQLFLWFVLVASVLIQAAVDGLNKPWHFYLYWTIAIFIIGVALQQFLRLGQLRKVVIPTALIGAVIAGACFAQTASFLKNRQAVGTASPLISDVASFLAKDRKKISLVCLNYSVCLPLLLLLKNAAIGGDYTFAPKGEGLMAQIDRAMAQDDSLLILREVDIQEKQKWLEFLNEGTRYFLEHADKNKYRQIKSSMTGGGRSSPCSKEKRGVDRKTTVRQQTEALTDLASNEWSYVSAVRALVERGEIHFTCSTAINLISLVFWERAVSRCPYHAACGLQMMAILSGEVDRVI